MLDMIRLIFGMFVMCLGLALCIAVPSFCLSCVCFVIGALEKFKNGKEVKNEEVIKSSE